MTPEEFDEILDEDLLDESAPKPCVPVHCPPLEEHVIDVIVPARDHVPGQFAREVAEFYGLPDPFPDDPPLGPCTCHPPG